MPYCLIKMKISLFKNNSLIDCWDFEHEIDDIYSLHFKCGTHIKRSISKKNDEELQEFTDWLAGYDDHINNVIWDFSEAMKDEYADFGGNPDEEIEETGASIIETKVVEFIGVFGERSFLSSNI